MRYNGGHGLRQAYLRARPGEDTQLRDRKAARHATRSALALLLILAGCALPGGIAQKRAGVIVSPMPSPDAEIRGRRLFFVEYLLKTRATTSRVGVLIEPLKSRLAFTLNPDRYVSGQVGTEEVGSLIGRFAPMRFHTIQSGKGKHLGYALLRPGESLRALTSEEGRFRLEITRKK